MTKTEALKTLRIMDDKSNGLFYIAHGNGLSFKCHGTAVSMKAAKKMLAEVKREPAAYFAPQMSR